jgi:hypothetical protein
MLVGLYGASRDIWCQLDKVQCWRREMGARLTRLPVKEGLSRECLMHILLHSRTRRTPQRRKLMSITSRLSNRYCVISNTTRSARFSVSTIFQSQTTSVCTLERSGRMNTNSLIQLLKIAARIAGHHLIYLNQPTAYGKLMFQRPIPRTTNCVGIVLLVDVLKGWAVVICQRHGP